VIYADTDALVGALPDLAAAYESAGVEAWTVWVPQGDARAAEAIEAAGHVLDAVPRAMGVELGAVEPPDLGELDWFPGCDLATVARVNDEAYGYGEDGFMPVISTLPPGEVHAYGVNVDGETSAVLIAIDAGEDVEIAWVATDEAVRGRGLATALMTQALWDARERGLTTATLQATRAGAPVYERVGFRDLGALEMWERRG
jgi:GNAT superfamily N-acetyltransferase